jgi:hypothetical protein
MKDRHLSVAATELKLGVVSDARKQTVAYFEAVKEYTLNGPAGD